MRTVLRAVAALLFVSSLTISSGSAQTLDNTVTTRLSFGTFPGAVQTTVQSVNPQESRNGRFVVFQSADTHLVPSPAISGAFTHVYLVDRQAGTIELISKAYDGLEAQGNSTQPAVSADGRYVTFASTAPVGYDFNPLNPPNGGLTSVCYDDVCDVNKSYAGVHIFVRDRLANETKLISQVTLPVQVPVLNADGSQGTEDDPDHPGEKRPKVTVVTKRIAAHIVSGAAATSSNPVINADGRYIAYDTDADNLAGVVPIITYTGPIRGTDYNVGPVTDGIIVTGDLQFSIYEPAGFYVDGPYRNQNVRDVYVRDGKDFSNALMSLGCKYHAPEGCDVRGLVDSINPGISDDGTFVTFQSAHPFITLDFNGVSDIFLVQRSQLNGEVSVLDRVSNNTTRILAANGGSSDVSMNGDGRFIAFQSAANDLVSTDTNGKADVFVYDSQFFTVVRCLAAGGVQANADVTNPHISGNGQYVVMQSAATNWGATSGNTNIYLGRLVRSANGALLSCTTELATVGAGFGGDGNSSNANVGLVPRTVSGTLTQAPAVVYQSLATNLHSGAADTNGVSDVFQAPTCAAIDLTTDTDGDGTTNCFDQCPTDPIKVEDGDNDGDGSPNCADACPVDALKTAAGLCGCGVPDTDSDTDGTPDCKDLCPNDPAKTAPGGCGCGFVDLDQNGNGVVDCKEVATGTPVAGTPTPTVPATPTPRYRHSCLRHLR